MLTYDRTLYVLDKEDRQRCEAHLAEGALLYRIASRSHWDREYIVNGAGPMTKKSKGRFHTVDQRTSYCANNILVCLSEMLYHMYRIFLAELSLSQMPEHLNASIKREQVRLAIFSVKQIDDLVYVDSVGAKAYDARMISTLVVFPDATYHPLHVISDALRMDEKCGVVYPSARHSEDFAFAFFKDETDNIREFYHQPPFINLRLVVEDQDTTSSPPREFKVYSDKLHATMGYYEFCHPDEFDGLKSKGLIYPATIPASGYVDFVRRHYVDYPNGAVRA